MNDRKHENFLNLILNRNEIQMREDVSIVGTNLQHFQETLKRVTVENEPEACLFYCVPLLLVR